MGIIPAIRRSENPASLFGRILAGFGRIPVFLAGFGSYLAGFEFIWPDSGLFGRILSHGEMTKVSAHAVIQSLASYHSKMSRYSKSAVCPGESGHIRGESGQINRIIVGPVASRPLFSGQIRIVMSRSAEPSVCPFSYRFFSGNLRQDQRPPMIPDKRILCSRCIRLVILSVTLHANRITPPERHRRSAPESLT